jgi:hypothetical protein
LVNGRFDGMEKGGIFCEIINNKREIIPDSLFHIPGTKQIRNLKFKTLTGIGGMEA